MAMWFLLFPAAVHAIAFPSPPATVTDPTTTTLSVSKTTSLPDYYGRHDLLRRATTEEADATICGYYTHDKDYRWACYYGNNCVFHASNTNFPGMVGCCPTASSSGTSTCIFYSTCYDSAEVARMTTAIDDPLAMLCTYTDGAYCFTNTWPALGVQDYQCTDQSSADPETLYTMGSLKGEEDEDDQITETIAVSWIQDDVLFGIKRAAASTTTTRTSTSTDTSTSTGGSSSSTTTGSEATTGVGAGSEESPSSTTGAEADSTGQVESGSGSGSSTSTGTIVGAVVGGVGGGLLVILIAAFFIWRHKKKQQALSANGQTPAAVVSDPSMHEDKQLGVYGTDAGDRMELMPEREYHELPIRQVRYELE